MLIGSPSIDPIIARDERHYEMMERGSAALASAIDAYRSKTIHGFKRAEPVWLMPFENGRRPTKYLDVRPTQMSRDPCVRCGVRYDQHAEGGCKSYRRARAA